jgi:hypothetical protein
LKDQFFEPIFTAPLDDNFRSSPSWCCQAEKRPVDRAAFTKKSQTHEALTRRGSIFSCSRSHCSLIIDWVWNYFRGERQISLALGWDVLVKWGSGNRRAVVGGHEWQMSNWGVECFEGVKVYCRWTHQCRFVIVCGSGRDDLGVYQVDHVVEEVMLIVAGGWGELKDGWVEEVACRRWSGVWAIALVMDEVRKVRKRWE